MEQKIKGSLLTKGFVEPLFLSKGGFGRVYRIKQEHTNRLYACKVALGEQRVHLQREIALLQGLHHPLYPGYQTAWEAGDCSFLVMEYISGSNLEELVIRRGCFREKMVRQIAMELATGLLLLHRKGMVFRDIKPRNILIRQDGRVKLLDFGCICAEEENNQAKVGTPGFAAPEQLHLGRAGVYSDVYALGRVMQYLLLGNQPVFMADRQLPMLWKECSCEKRLKRVVELCIQSDIENRIPDMEFLIRLLQSRKIQSNYVVVENIWKIGG